MDRRTNSRASCAQAATATPQNARSTFLQATIIHFICRPLSPKACRRSTELWRDWTCPRIGECGRAAMMDLKRRYAMKLSCILLALAGSVVLAQDGAAPAGPDPREIPVPRIKTPMGTLPGVKDL